MDPTPNDESSTTEHMMGCIDGWGIVDSKSTNPCDSIRKYSQIQYCPSTSSPVAACLSFISLTMQHRSGNFSYVVAPTTTQDYAFLHKTTELNAMAPCVPSDEYNSSSYSIYSIRYALVGLDRSTLPRKVII